MPKSRKIYRRSRISIIRYPQVYFWFWFLVLWRLQYNILKKKVHITKISLMVNELRLNSAIFSSRILQTRLETMKHSLVIRSKKKNSTTHFNKSWFMIRAFFAWKGFKPNSQKNSAIKTVSDLNQCNFLISWRTRELTADLECYCIFFKKLIQCRDP